MKHLDTKLFLLFVVLMIPVFIVFQNQLENNYINQILLFSLPLLWPGLAHGSLDISIAKKNKIINNNLQTLTFIIIYLTIPFCFFIFWLYFPKVLFTIFLILSILHFGISDCITKVSGIRFFEILIRGVIVICLPFKFHSEKSIEIFSYFLVNESFLVNSLTYFNYLYYFLLFLILFWFVTSFSRFLSNDRNFISSLEIVILFFCFWFYQPLISFFLYFCFLHSTRHLIDEQKVLGFSFLQLILKTIPLTFVTLVFFIAIFLVFDGFPYNLNISYVVIGLSSLTTSHIFLVNFTKNNHE